MDWTLLSMGIGVGIVGIAGLAWAWDHLYRLKTHKEVLQSQVLAHAEQRRDTLPYLLESQWGVHPRTEAENAVVHKRAEARDAKDFNAIWKCEEELEALLEELWTKTQGDAALKKDLGWMEAKTDILQETEALNDLEEKYLRAKLALEVKLQKFPFMVFRKQFKI